MLGNLRATVWCNYFSSSMHNCATVSALQRIQGATQFRPNSRRRRRIVPIVTTLFRFICSSFSSAEIQNEFEVQLERRIVGVIFGFTLIRFVWSSSWTSGSVTAWNLGIDSCDRPVDVLVNSRCWRSFTPSRNFARYRRCDLSPLKALRLEIELSGPANPATSLPLLARHLYRRDLSPVGVDQLRGCACSYTTRCCIDYWPEGRQLRGLNQDDERAACFIEFAVARFDTIMPLRKPWSSQSNTWPALIPVEEIQKESKN